MNIKLTSTVQVGEISRTFTTELDATLMPENQIMRAMEIQLTLHRLWENRNDIKQAA